MPDIKANLKSIRQRISSAAQKSGRKSEDVKLIAATKTIPVELIEQAIQAGITDIGENKVQEAIPKIAALRQKYSLVRWHMVGHLQRNKARQAVENFDLIQSVDSERLGREIEAQAQAQVPILIEVNTSGEMSKFGVAPELTVELLTLISKFRNIRVQGLMTIGLFTNDLEKVRPCFVKLRNLSEKIKNLNLPNVEMKYLSMGMTDDFEVAVAEGSNMVRIGRAIFGKRS
ncbi:YggS family pyridoxal phosphate-dependent enzyme [Candidatus Margulisiibacteriota bacterium]